MPDGFDFGDLGFGGEGGGAGDLSQYIPQQAPGTSLNWNPGNVGSGGGSWLDTLSGYANQALPFLRLGAQGLGAFSGIEGMINAGQQRNFLNTAQKNLQTAAAPGLAGAQQLIPAGTQALMGGPLPPQLEATVNQWIQSETAKYRQALAHMGITDSTMMQGIESQIAQQAQVLRAQLAQGLLTGGQGMSGQAIQAAGAGGQLAANQQNMVASALSQADQAMARLLGASG